MTGLDWAIVAAIVASIVMAAAKGFFYQMFSLAGCILGLVLAAWEYRAIAPWFTPYVKSEPVAYLVSFFAIFFTVFVIAGMAGALARWIVKEAGLSIADRCLGAAFGLVRGLVLVTAVILGWATFAPNSPALARSELGRYFLLTARVAIYVAPSEVREKFRAGIEQLRSLRPEPAQPVKAGGASKPPATSEVARQ